MKSKDDVGRKGFTKQAAAESETEKGKICATSTSDRGTLKTYGYCDTNRSLSGVEKGTKKKAPKKTLKKWKL